MQTDQATQGGSLAGAARIMGELAVSTWRSPLKKYVGYSLVIHVVVIGLLSVGTLVSFAKGMMGIETAKVEQPAEGAKAKPGEAAAPKPTEGAEAKTPEKAGPPAIEDSGKKDDKTPRLEDML